MICENNEDIGTTIYDFHKETWFLPVSEFLFKNLKLSYHSLMIQHRKFAYHACLRANVVYVPHTCVPAWFTCQRAWVSKSVPTSHFYVPINVLTCHKACQCFNLVCQRAKWRANFSTWRANNVPKCVPNFQTFSYEMLSEISMHYYYIKHSTFYLIS